MDFCNISLVCHFGYLVVKGLIWNLFGRLIAAVVSLGLIVALKMLHIDENNANRNCSRLHSSKLSTTRSIR